MSAKTQQDLTQSREIHSYLRSVFGFSPRSVLEEDWSIHTKKSHLTYGQQSEQIYGDDKLANNSAVSLSGVGARHGSFSDFPHHTARNLLRFYLYDGGEPKRTADPGYFGNYLPVVLDPFAGHNSRMEDCYSLGLNYIGHDICAEFMKANRALKDELVADNARSMFPHEAKMELVEGDSRLIDRNSIADLAITSPPFWNIEDYGPEKNQLGKVPYEPFLFALGLIIHNCYNALKDNSMMAIETNDFRYKNHFYTYHADVIKLLTGAGFEMHDIIIVDYGASFMEVFLTEVEHYKIMPKCHSYILVARKGKVSSTASRKETRRKLSTAATSAVEQGKIVKQGRLDDGDGPIADTDPGAEHIAIPGNITDNNNGTGTTVATPVIDVPVDTGAVVATEECEQIDKQVDRQERTNHSLLEPPISGIAFASVLSIPNLILDNTPIEQYQASGRIVHVKREDLCATMPLPPLSKLRGMVVLLQNIQNRGIKLVGGVDTRYSKSGWGLAVLTRQMGMKCIIGYPSNIKAISQKPDDSEIPEPLKKAREYGADIMPFSPNHIKVIYAQTKNIVRSRNGLMLPFGLTCAESTLAVAREAATVPEELLTGSLVVCVGTATILSGILLGLKKVPPQVIGVSSGMSADAQRSNLASLLFEAGADLGRMNLAKTVTIIPPIMPYSTLDGFETPVPMHRNYDTKSFHWLVDNIDNLKDPILFWLIGA